MKMNIIKFLLCLLLTCGVMFLGCAASDGDDDDDEPDINDDDADDDSDDDADDDQSDSSMLVGFAQIDITPQIPVKLAGYDMFFLSEQLCRWSTDVHDPLYAQAMAFDDPKTDSAVILIVLDVIGLMRPDIEKIQNKIVSALPVNFDEVIVAATHTHHGPDTIGIWGVMIPPISGRQEEIVEQMIDGAANAAIEAWNLRVPATLKYAQGTFSEWHENIIDEDPDRLLDDAITILAAYDDEENILGTCLNWSAHPTVMGQDSTVVSSDFPGVYYRLLGDELGGVNLFVNGAIGAMIQPTNKWSAPDEWNEVEDMGRALADKALLLTAEAMAIENASIASFISLEAPVKLTNPIFPLAGALGLIVRNIPPLGEHTNCRVTSFAIGPVTFGTMPGEFVPDYALRFREIMGGEAQFLIGLGMDWIGYVLTPRQASHPAYLYERALCPSAYAGDGISAIYEDIWGYED